MKTIESATLISDDGPVVLEDVTIDSNIDDLMAVVNVCQRYRNPGMEHVEAVYTFPLPLNAQLLDFSVEIGDRKLAGQVIARHEAEERYEDALTDGDAAVMLEEPQPGIYTANVGNLAPNEAATIRFRYGLLLRWNGKKVRISLPTTIAPRYGDPAAGGLQEHQVPEFVMEAGRAFHLRVAVRGLLRNALWTSPTHNVVVDSGNEQTIVEMVKSDAMDRDLVLEATATKAGGSEILIDRDGSDWVVLASIQPEISDADGQRVHRNIKIVVDCSGSMYGDSIAQVRIAGERILGSLHPGDHFDIITFGSNHRALFGRAVPVSSHTLSQAYTFMHELDADMGGTEIAGALRAAYGLADQPDAPRDSDVLLITDGEVWDTSAVLKEARASGHRVFTIGVGHAPAEPLLRELADATGGACEMVTPSEDMADRIHRHFQRILSPPAQQVRVHWPATPIHAVPNPPPPPFPGDTIHLFGWFKERPEGSVILEVELNDGRTLQHQLDISSPSDNKTEEGALLSDLARMGAALRLKTIDDDARATEFAVRYQLVSQWTNCLVIHVRDDEDKADVLPTTVKIPQELAHGWHGISQSVPMIASQSPAYYAQSGSPRIGRIVNLSYDNFSPPRAPLHGGEILESWEEPEQPSAEELAGIVISKVLAHIYLPLDITLDDLVALGMPEDLIDNLRKLVDDGADPQTIAITLLKTIAAAPFGDELDRQVRRQIRFSYKKQQADTDTISAVQRVWDQWYANPSLDSLYQAL